MTDISPERTHSAIELEASGVPQQIQSTVVDYLYFGNRLGVNYRDKALMAEDRELSAISYRQIHELQVLLDTHHTNIVVTSCDDPSDPLIIFRKSEDGYNVEKTRVLEPGEEFCGRLVVGISGGGRDVKVVSSGALDSDPNSELAYLCVGANGPEFAIAGLRYREP